MSYPFNWFWLADDARVYDSARQIITNDADANYIAWTDAGNTATIWPRDASGNQTNAELQTVLAPYGLFVNLVYYAADARYRRAIGGLTITSLSATKKFITDPVARNTLANANEYAKVTPHDTDWKMSDGTFIVLNPTQLTTAANAMANFVQTCFTCESTTVASINGGSITTQAQVNAAFAAIANVVP